MTKPRVEIWFELETRCNLDCKFCYNFWKDGTSAEPSRLDTHQTLKVLSVLFESIDCTKMCFSGGEPLLRKDLFELLAFVHARRVPIVLTTNGTLLNRATVSRLIDSGVQTFQIPIHSTRREIHDYLSGHPCWRQTLSALVDVREAGVGLAGVFVATSINVRDLPKVIDLCGLIGINRLIFNRFIPGGLGLRHRAALGVPSDEDVLSVLEEANRSAASNDAMIFLGTPIPIPDAATRFDRVRSASCPVGRGQRRWTVDAEGGVRRCNHVGTVVGNILTDGPTFISNELAAFSPATSEYQGCCLEDKDGLVRLRF